MARATAEQRAWFAYDWANSAYITTVATVLYAPYLTNVAERAACGYVGSVERRCTEHLSVLGVSLSAGSLVFYVVTLSTLLSAFVLPVVGAIADRVDSKRRFMARLAWAGAAVTALMFFVTGTRWELGVVLLIVSNILYLSSIVVYDALLIDVAAPAERNRISSRGWAFGYLGGGLLLAANLALVRLTPFGISADVAVRVSLLSAAVWWAAFTVIPYLGIRDRAPLAGSAKVTGTFGQLWRTLKEIGQYPQTLLFLLAYLIYNDGIQTVIYSASVYGEKELGFETEALIILILTVQFVGIAGALLFGRLAAVWGTQRTIGLGLVIWIGAVIAAFRLPAGEFAPFLAVGVAIGIVLGGTQALSRSFYSHFIPRGKEAEYYSLYQACERGTSWIGTFAFGVVHQMTDSYRPALLVLGLFFVVGGALLWRLDPRRAAAEAGNPVPVVL